jgi:hypothetical protein
VREIDESRMHARQKVSLSQIAHTFIFAHTGPHLLCLMQNEQRHARALAASGRREDQRQGLRVDLIHDLAILLVEQLRTRQGLVDGRAHGGGKGKVGVGLAVQSERMIEHLILRWEMARKIGKNSKK